MGITNNKMAWYEHWFNSPYYSILYKHRDAREARHFLDKLTAGLKLKKGCRILDLACGSGRHSLYLWSKGYEVTGIDLADEMIRAAKRSVPSMKKKRPSFLVHDMRKPVKKNYFDVVLNLFTSFGYFDNEKDDLQVLRAVNSAMKKGGLFALDFMNVKKIARDLTHEESKITGNIKFDICRSLEDGFIIKRIRVEEWPPPGKTKKNMGSPETHYFEEKVRALGLQDFQKYFSATGFEVRNIFGDYDLRTFDEENSARLILVVMKK